MERLDEFLATINEEKFEQYTKGMLSKDADFWFDGIASYDESTRISTENEEKFVRMISLETTVRVLRDYQKFLEENPR